jgi:hypothetical protein
VNVVRAKSAAWAAAGAALAAPVLLATAGTARAVPDPGYASNGVMTIRYYDAPMGLTAKIWDDSNPDGVTEVCHYGSSGVGGTPLLPFDGNAYLNGNGPGSVFIPGQPRDGRWSVTVHCDGTGQSLDFRVTY